MEATAGAGIRRRAVLQSRSRRGPRLATTPAPADVSLREAAPDVARGHDWIPATFLLAVGLAAVMPVVAAEWGLRSASSWQAHVERVSRALADQDEDGAATAWAEAYSSAMRADGDWRGAAAVAEAWRELVRRSGPDAAGVPGATRLYRTALSRAVEGGDIEGV